MTTFTEDREKTINEILNLREQLTVLQLKAGYGVQLELEIENKLRKATIESLEDCKIKLEEKILQFI